MKTSSLLAFSLAGVLAGCAVDDPDDLTPDAGTAAAALCAPGQSCAPSAPAAIEPLRPPLPTANAAGQLALVVVRAQVQEAVKQIITDFNKRGKGTLSWIEKPLSCGYHCNMPPMASSDGYTHERSWTTVRLHYSRYLGIVQRDISIEVNLYATCVDWLPTAAGELVISVRPSTPYVSGGSWLEGFADFLSPIHFADYITAQVAGGSGSPAATQLRLGSCRTIGVYSGYPDVPNADAFVWDK